MINPKNKIPEDFDAEAAEEAHLMRQVRRVRRQERKRPNRKSIDQRDAELRQLLDDILAE